MAEKDFPITLVTPNSPGAPADPSKDPADPSNNVNYPVEGWPTLSKVIAQKPDLEAFATFTDLNIKSLLYYQAELICLRKRLHKLEWGDSHAPKKRLSPCLYAENVEALISARDRSIKSHNDGSDKPVPMPEQWTLIEKIRETLDKYNTALLQFSEMAALRDADKSNVATLMGCVKQAGKDHRPLMGNGAYAWGNYNKIITDDKPLPDLFWNLFTVFSESPDDGPEVKYGEFKEHFVVPRPGKNPDGLTQWVTRTFIPFYDQLWKEDISVCKKYPQFKKYQKYLGPFRVILILLGLIFRSLWRLFGLLLHKLLFSSTKGPEPDPEQQDRRPSDASSNDSTLAPGSIDSKITNNSEASILSGFVEYSGQWILRVTSTVTTVIACLLPTVAITVLAKVHSMSLILGLIALFTGLFSIGLVLLSSSSSRVEIFTATAAFSAVMVVFVQSQIGPQQQSSY